MLYNSGIGINQLGDFTTCNELSGYRYATIRVKSGITKRSVDFWMGLCMPLACSEDDIVEIIGKWYRDFAEAVVIPGAQVNVTFPVTERQEILGSFDPGFYIMISIIAIILLMGVIGILVDLTDCGNKHNLDPRYLQLPDKEKDKYITKIKDKWALLCLGFSFSRNVRKIVTPGGEGDSKLKILNGIRFLSMCWVILGHSYSSSVN